MYSSTRPLNSALDGGEWSASNPGRFTAGERVPGTHWIGGWTGPRAHMDAVVRRKSPRSFRESNSSCLVRSLATVLTELFWIWELQ